MTEDARSGTEERMEAKVQELSAQLQQTNRARRMLSRFSRAVIQAEEESALLAEVCRLIVEVGGYRLTWVGLAEQDEDRTVRPVAQAGYEDGYLETLDITWADSERGWGPTGTAIRTGQPSIAQDILDDPSFGPWRRHALKRGYASSIALPLITGEKTLGALCIYAARPDAFDQVETRLLQDLAGNLAFGLAALRNRAKRHRAEEQVARLGEEAAEAQILREMDRLRSEFVANVSHEIRTPLGLIEVGCSSLLMEDVEFEPEIQKQFLMGIRRETEKLKAIVDDLLHLSRLDSGQLFLNRRTTDVALLAQEVINAMQAQTQLHRMVHEFPQGPLLAQVDSGQVEQVLRNLVSNACKYSPEGGTVTVQGWDDQCEITLCVRDKGIGIPLNEQERVFGRFYRIEHEVTQRVGGAGLGLAVCRGIVEAHGGRIWAESNPGEGSSFFFTLPLVAE